MILLGATFVKAGLPFLASGWVAYQKGRDNGTNFTVPQEKDVEAGESIQAKILDRKTFLRS